MKAMKRVFSVSLALILLCGSALEAPTLPGLALADDSVAVAPDGSTPLPPPMKFPRK